MNVKYTIQQCLENCSGENHLDWVNVDELLSLDEAIKTFNELKEYRHNKRFRLLKERFEVIG